MDLGQSFEGAIADLLFGAGERFERDVPLGGARADFVVWRADTPLAALEVVAPALDYAADRLRVKLKYARDYSLALKGLPVLLVVPDLLSRFADETNIVTPSHLLESLARLRFRLRPEAAKALIQPANTRTVFASMPFSDEYVDTFKAIRYAADKIDFVAEKVDHDYLAADIVKKIKDKLRVASFVVVDVSGARPSVLHEYGFAEALARPIIAISSTPLAELPFNVRNNTTEPYIRGNSVPLRRFLLKAFRTQVTRLP